MRLDRFISSQGKFSRTEAKKLIKSGLVTVDGEAVKAPDIQVNPENSGVFVNGEPFIYKKHIYIMLNKPKGVVSATEDARHKTVLDLVPKELFRDGLFPAGRLDSDTTGFVLITDDGDFAHKILSPKNHVDKTYIAELAEPVFEQAISELENGIVLKDGSSLMPCKVNRINDRKLEIIIREGKYHQIKRMMAAVDNRVLELKRTKIGGLQLDVRLLPGECREITQEEIAVITN